MNRFTKMAEDWIRQNSGGRTALLEPVPSLAPVASLEDFRRWWAMHCIRHERCAGAVGGLHLDFCEWAWAHGSVPCTRQSFELLLNSSGFPLVDGMVCGLLLRQDFEDLKIYPEFEKMLNDLDQR